MQLGLSSIMVQELVNSPEEEGKILGTSITLSVVSSFACIAGVTAFAAIANRGEPVTIIVCLLYSLNLIFQALEMIRYWFQARLISKYTSIISLVAYVRAELKQMKFRKNRLAKTILDANHGKLKSFVLRNAVTAGYGAARIVTGIVYR